MASQPIVFAVVLLALCLGLIFYLAVYPRLWVRWTSVAFIMFVGSSMLHDARSSDAFGANAAALIAAFIAFGALVSHFKRARARKSAVQDR